MKYLTTLLDEEDNVILKFWFESHLKNIQSLEKQAKNLAKKFNCDYKNLCIETKEE